MVRRCEAVDLVANEPAGRGENARSSASMLPSSDPPDCPREGTLVDRDGVKEPEYKVMVEEKEKEKDIGNVDRARKHARKKSGEKKER